MSKILKRNTCAAVVAVAMLLVFAPSASADHVTVGFTCITPVNNPDCSDVAAQMSLVIHVSGDVVSFKFSNTGALASFIANVYWDDDLGLFAGSSVGNPANWTSPGSPGDLPQGGSIGFTVDFSSGADSPGPDGIHPGEMLTFTLTLVEGKTMAMVISAIISGELRFGLKVQGMGEGNNFSDAMVNTTPIPEPGSMLLLGTGLLGLGGAIRRRRKKV